MNAWYIIRSLVFYLGYTAIIVVLSAVSLTIGLLLPHRPRQRLITTANALIIRWFNLACGVTLVVEGLDNIPNQPFVALSKHQSAWETFYLQRLFCPVSTILKRELLKIPFFGWGLALTKPIAINRSNPRDAMRQVLDQGLARLADGNNVLIYPEGTRMPHGTKGKYGRSGAALAIKAGAPLLPVAHNAGQCWPADHWIKRPGTIHIVIGQPLDVTGMDSRALIDAAEQWIESTVEKLDSSN